MNAPASSSNPSAITCGEAVTGLQRKARRKADGINLKTIQYHTVNKKAGKKNDHWVFRGIGFGH